MLWEPAMNGDAESENWLGDIFLKGDDDTEADWREAAKWYFRAAARKRRGKVQPRPHVP